MSKLAGDEFKQAVYDLTRLIPCGRVTSYGAIARCIGSAGSARRVGWALNQCFHETPPVPAHRVVNRNGLLTGAVHFSSEAPMADRLEAEGVHVVENQIVNLERVFWEPWTAAELMDNAEL